MSTADLARVSLKDFDNRKEELAEQLFETAKGTGFFYVVDHGIDQGKLDEMWKTSKSFFDLPPEKKADHKYRIATNNGWEAGEEILNEGIPDFKETFNLGWQHMEGLWPEEELPEFKGKAQDFMADIRALALKLLSLFATKLGFEENFFEQHLDNSKLDCTSVLRLLCYPDTTGKTPAPGQMRAGHHTDYGCLTLLFQRGEKGLQVCPGNSIDGEWETGAKVDPTNLDWLEVEPIEGAIVCNIGDCLMRWSDDQLRSNLHRVRFPNPDEPNGPRYSMAFFNQPNKSSVIEGPGKKYPKITAGAYLEERFGSTYTKEAGGKIEEESAE